MQDPLLYAALGLVDLLAVDHALGDEDEVARPALDTLAAAWAKFQPQAPLGLEHIGVVARVDMPAGPGAGVGSGPTGPDVVVGERLATVHPGRLGSRAVQRIRSDQDGSVHGGPAFRSGMRSSLCRQAMGDKVPEVLGESGVVRT